MDKLLKQQQSTFKSKLVHHESGLVSIGNKTKDIGGGTKKYLLGDTETENMGQCFQQDKKKKEDCDNSKNSKSNVPEKFQNEDKSLTTNVNFVTVKVDIGLAIGYAVFFILILSSDISYLVLHKDSQPGQVHTLFVECVIGIKIVVLLTHLIIYILLYKVRGLRRKLHQYIIYWELFMIAIGTHLCSIQEFYLDDEDDRQAKHKASEDIELLILQIYTVWALYLILPISILKNEVRMRPMQKQMNFTTIVIISLVIKLYPGFLIISGSPKKMFNVSFISRLLLIDFMHCMLVFVIRSMLFQVQFLKEENDKQSMSRIKEIKKLLEKMPEGILIMPENQRNLCYMNQELTYVLKQMGISQGSCCCPGDKDGNTIPQEHIPEDYDEKEAFGGLYKKIFKLYSQSEEQLGTPRAAKDEQFYKEKSIRGRRGTQRTPERLSQNEELISLKDIIDAFDWKEDEERFFEIIPPQDYQVEDVDFEQGSEKSIIQDERIFVQIKRVSVEYLQQPAKMIVIRDISLIIEFEKEKNENKYQELLTATMSHEMLTPLNSIINLSIYLEQRLQQRQIREDQHTVNDGNRGSCNDKNELKQSISFVNIIKSSANILQFIIKDMIDLMNLRLDRFNQQIIVFSPIDACNEIIHYYEIQAREKGIYLKRMISNDSRGRIAKLASDKQRYMQILLNIVQNSVKFTYFGGVEIILDFQPQFKIGGSYSSVKSPENNIIRSQNRQNSSCLDCGSIVTLIKDTGIGIPKADVERLFKIFGNVNRGQQSSLITTQGIGLGLTVCKQLVEKLGGQIHLSSVPNIGTEVQFSLPAKCINCFKLQVSDHNQNSHKYSSLAFNHQNHQDLSGQNNPIQSNAAAFSSYQRSPNNKLVSAVIPNFHEIQGSFTSYSNVYMNNTTNLIRHSESNYIVRDLAGQMQQCPQSRFLGNSQGEQVNKTLSKSQTCNMPMTPQVKRFKRRPFGGEISIASNINGVNKLIHHQAFEDRKQSSELRNEEKFGDSVKTELYHRQNEQQVRHINQSEEQHRGFLFSNNQNSRTQSIPNRSNALPMGSIKSKFANKCGNNQTDAVDSSYPNRPSNEESKSRGITDSRNVAIASEFVTSSNFSIQDKLMKKSFATKVLHENNQRLNSIINKLNYQPGNIKEEFEPSIDKSQDIRNLLESSNMSVNDEISLTEKPFQSNEQIVPFCGVSPSSKNSPKIKLQTENNRITKCSIRGLEPYTVQTTHQNDLKFVNILNKDQSFNPLLQILEGEKSDDNNFEFNDENSLKQEKVFSVVTLQPIQMSPRGTGGDKQQQNINNQLLTINYGNKNDSSCLKSSQSAEQIFSKEAIQDNNVGGIPEKNQTGFFPMFQKTNCLNNDNFIVNENQIQTKIVSNEEVQVNYDLSQNQRPSCKIIAYQQNSKSSYQKNQEMMSSVDVTPQFNELSKQDCSKMNLNSTERAIKNDKEDFQTSNGNHVSINQQRVENVQSQSLREMLFQQKILTKDKKSYQQKSSNDQYQPIATFTAETNQQNGVSLKQNNFQEENKRIERKESKKFSNLNEEEEPGQESQPQLFFNGKNNSRQEKTQQNIEDVNNDDQAQEEIKLNLRDEMQGESLQQFSGIKKSYNNVNQQNQVVSIKNNQLVPNKKDCGCESTVLIVDDNFFNLLPLELILRETFGILTDKALNGQEALVKFVRYNIQKTCQCGMRYKLILMDLNMPVMDGYKASREIIRMHKLQIEKEEAQQPKNAGSGESYCQNIASEEKDQDLYIVAQTAFVNDENIMQCYEAGMVDVIHKPLSQESIKQVLDRFYYQRDGLQQH